MVEFSKEVTDWLDEDKENVVVIHCKGGKGKATFFSLKKFKKYMEVKQNKTKKQQPHLTSFLSSCNYLFTCLRGRRTWRQTNLISTDKHVQWFGARPGQSRELGHPGFPAGPNTKFHLLPCRVCVRNGAKTWCEKWGSKALTGANAHTYEYCKILASKLKDGKEKRSKQRKRRKGK